MIRIWHVSVRPLRQSDLTSSSKFLDVYESSVFLEAKDESLWILAPTWKPHRKNNWDCVLLSKSTEGRQTVLRLRPLDTFMSANQRFVLNYVDKEDDPFDSQKNVHLSGDSQLSMGGYEKSEVTDHLEYLPVRSDDSLEAPRNQHHSELRSDKENEIPVPNLAKKEPKKPVTLEQILKVVENLPHGHPAYPHQRLKIEPEEASDSDATVDNEKLPIFHAVGPDNSVIKWLDPAIPQIDGSVDEANIEAPGQVPISEAELTDDAQKPPTQSSPVDHSTLTVFEDSMEEPGESGLDVDGEDIPTSTDTLEHGRPLEDARMPPPPLPAISKKRSSPSSEDDEEESSIHESIEVQQRDTLERGRPVEDTNMPPPPSPVITKKRSSLSGENDEEDHSIRESIEVQPRDSSGASSEPSKKKLKSSSDHKPPASLSAPRSPSKSKKSSKSQQSSKSRRSSTSSSGASSTAEERREGRREERREEAVSTPSKNLRSSAERYTATYAESTIVFSSNISIQNKPAMMKFLKDNGVTAVEEMKDATMFCVGKGELKKTARLIKAIVSGKDIVTDSWVTDSVKKRRLLDVVGYIPSDKKHEKEWKFKLAEAVQRGKDDYKPLQGFRVYFSKALAKAGGTELKEIAILAGAEYCGAQIKKPADDLLVMLTGEDDADVEKFVTKGFRSYAKELLTLGILREELDLDSREFQISLDSESDEL